MKTEAVIFLRSLAKYHIFQDYKECSISRISPSTERLLASQDGIHPVDIFTCLMIAYGLCLAGSAEQEFHGTRTVLAQQKRSRLTLGWFLIILPPILTD
jgi:hypothetical protein